MAVINGDNTNNTLFGGAESDFIYGHGGNDNNLSAAAAATRSMAAKATTRSMAASGSSFSMAAPETIIITSTLPPAFGILTSSSNMKTKARTPSLPMRATSSATISKIST